MAADDFPTDLKTYAARQRALQHHQRAPTGRETFETLRQPNSPYVFRDFTPFLRSVLEQEQEGGFCLIRGRRWGKTTFGCAWLAYLRCDRALFAGTAVHDMMPDRPMIGVHWDFSQAQNNLLLLSKVLHLAVKTGILYARRQGYQVPHWTYQTSESDDPNTALSIVIDQMADYALDSPLQFSLFIDEYDIFVTSEEDPDRLEQLNGFFYHLFSNLKSHAKSSGAIPFQFITGTSRMAFNSFYSGPNAINDLSFDPALAQSLGYTWEQISALFSTQLRWLQVVKQMTLEELRENLTRWYDQHRWSPASSEHVFNPHSIHEFIRTGCFTAHWAATGSISAAIHSKPLLRNLLRAVSKTQSCITVRFSALNSSKLPHPNAPRSDETQLALLVGSGILAIRQAGPEEDPMIELAIPNMDAAAACWEILKSASASSLNHSREGRRTVVAPQTVHPKHCA